MAMVCLAALPSTASAAGVAYPDADWSEAWIQSPSSAGNATLHADVLRPKGATAADEDAGDHLDRAVLQPLGPDRPRGSRRGHQLRPGRPERGPVGALPGLRRGLGAAQEGLQLRDGRPARLRRVEWLPRLVRAGRAGRRRQRREVGGEPAVVDREGRDVWEVLRRADRPDRGQQAPRRPRGGRLAGTRLRRLPLPVRRRHAPFELRADARALRRDRGDARAAHGRSELQRQLAQRPGLPGAELRRPGRERRPRLGVLEAAEPHPRRRGLEGAAVPDSGADGEQHGGRRTAAVPRQPHRLRARVAWTLGARSRQRNRRLRPPEDGPRRMVRRGDALLRPTPEGRQVEGQGPDDRGADQRRRVAR